MSLKISSITGVAIIGTGSKDKFLAPSEEANNQKIGEEERLGKAAVYIIDLDTGGVKQILYLYARLTGVPLYEDGNIYAFDHFGYLYSFSRDN